MCAVRAVAGVAGARHTSQLSPLPAQLRLLLELPALLPGRGGLLTHSPRSTLLPPLGLLLLLARSLPLVLLQPVQLVQLSLASQLQLRVLQ